MPTFVWSAALVPHEGKHRIKTRSYSDSNNTHWNTSEWANWLQVCVPSTPMQTYSESLQRYVCVQKLTTNFLKTQNALKSPKFELLSLWCLNYKLEYLWVLMLLGTKKGFLVQISFSVLAIKMKGDLGLTKKPSSSLVVSSVQRVSSQNSKYSEFLHLQF